MIEKLVAMIVGYFVCKAMGGLENAFGSFFPGQAPSPGQLPALGPAPTTVKQGERPAQVPPGAIPVVAPSAAWAPEALPKGLPPFPGSGWTFAKPTPAVVQRAWALLRAFDYKLGRYKVEPSPDDPSKWLAYRCEKHAGGKTGVTVYTPKGPVAPPTSPAPAPPVYVSTSAPKIPVSEPSARPTLRKGSKGSAVVEWQTRIGVPADGSFGPVTEQATKAWQTAHGLKADGIVGPLTWASAQGVTT